jgi:hypothetical protein
MLTAHIVRTEDTKYGTFGYLSIPYVGFSCYTGEPPWKNNRNSVSCIPTGEYDVRIRRSPKYGIIFHVKNVEGRSYILIHSGNYAGDVERGLRSHTMGCILLGKSRGWLAKQKVVLNSRLALKSFMRLMKNDTFKLIIS